MTILETAARAMFWVAVLGISAGLGALVTGQRRAARTGDLVWDAASGLAPLIAGLLAIGMVPGAFRALPLALMLGTAAAAAVIVEWRRPRSAPPRRGKSGLVLATILCCVVVLGLAWDRVPTPFFDALVYHLAQPGLWLTDGRIAPVSWSVYSWFPPGMSVLYGVGLAFGGQPLALDANLLLGLLLLALCGDLGSRAWGPWAAPWAAGLAASLPLVVYALGIPGADLAHGTFVLGALGAWWAAGREPERAATWRRRSALLTAGACLTKYTGFLLPLAFGALLWMGRERRWRAAVAFALPSLLLLAPWLMANARITGNPVAPAGASLWPVSSLADGALPQLKRDMRGGLPTASDLRSLGPRLFAGAPDEDPIYPTPAWGWSIPLLLGAALFSARVDPPTRAFLALAAAALLFWLLTYRWERFLVAPSALIALAAAGTLANWTRLGFVARALAALGVTASLLGAALALGSVGRFTGGGAVALGRETPDAFLRRSLPILDLYATSNQRLGTHDQVLLFGETRHFGLSVRHAAPSVYNRHPLVGPLAEGHPPSEIVAQLRASGYTHLLVDLGWAARSAATLPSLAPLRGRGPELSRFLRALGPPLAADGGGRTLYRLDVQR